jgi:hypothetical protein
LAAFSVLAASADARPPSPAPLRILFIGNSLTTANDLPAMVEKLSSSSAGPRVQCDVVAFPNYSLEDHWARGDAVKAIARGGWTTVILQQGPSALPESRVLLREYTRKFNTEIRRAGATTALYMVWPSAARRGDFDGVKTSYHIAAQDVAGLFLPVGEAWRAVWKRDARIDLWGPDGFHPTPDATYLAALVIYQRLTGTSPAGLPPPWAMPPARAAILQQAAAEVRALQ